MTSTKLEQELEAIRTGAAIYPLTDRAFLRITGSDATRWLNGMVTNSIQSLAPGEGNYNFLLNAQGRIQADCTIYRDPDGNEPKFVLETDQSQIETIEQLLDKFIIMDDVELKRMDYYHGTCLVFGHKASEVLRSMEADEELDHPLTNLAPLHIGYYKTADQIATPLAGSLPAFEIAGCEPMLSSMVESLKTAGAIQISSETLEAHRILSATPKFGQDIRDRDLPQETAQTHALHFAKGCYLGQEIVERIRSRGQVHRTFTAFTLTGQIPELPATLEANGKPAGELTSAIQIGDTLHALGYLRREAATQRLTYPGGTATPRVAS